MTTHAVQGATARTRDARFWRRLCWVTVALLLASAVATVLMGAQQESYGRLLAGLRDGSVRQVRVIGAMGGEGGLSHDEQGWGIVHLVWRHGWHDSVAEVLQTSSADVSTSTGGNEPRDIVVGSMAAPLKAANPAVRLTFDDHYYSGVTTTFWDWELASPWALVLMLPLLMWLAILVGGPEPRLATRWGWFWLTLTPLGTLVMLAFLTVGQRRRGPLGRRLGGWMAWLIMMLSGIHTVA